MKWYSYLFIILTIIGSSVLGCKYVDARINTDKSYYYAAYEKGAEVYGVELKALLNYNSNFELQMKFSNGETLAVEEDLVRLYIHAKYVIEDYIYWTDTSDKIIGYVVKEIDRPDFYEEFDKIQKRGK